MPRTTREKIKRRIDSVLGHYDKAIYQLTKLADQFAEHHPEFSVIYGGQIEGLQMMREVMERIKAVI